jgi:hypothetical protein
MRDWAQAFVIAALLVVAVLWAVRIFMELVYG